MATLVFAFDLGLLSFLSWTWSVSWWKDDQLKELWWGPLKKATKKSALPPDYDLSSFFSGRWLVCWINLVIPTCNLDLPTCKTPNSPEKKLDIPPPLTWEVAKRMWCKMSWWSPGCQEDVVLVLVLFLVLSCLGLGLGSWSWSLSCLVQVVLFMKRRRSSQRR